MGAYMVYNSDKSLQTCIQHGQLDPSSYQNIQTNAPSLNETAESDMQIHGYKNGVRDAQGKVRVSYARGNSRNSARPVPPEAGGCVPTDKRDRFSKAGVVSHDLSATSCPTLSSEREREIRAFKEFSNRLPITSQYDSRTEINPSMTQQISGMKGYETKSVRNE